MKKNTFYFLLIITFVLGIFFRVYKFNQIPSSLNWDEIAIGWNAASIWEAKIDQYGTRWPISFKSYGDYKAPFLIYFTALFIGLFGMESWVVRLPVLIFSLLTIFVFFLLSKEIVKFFKFKTNQAQLFTLLSTLFFSISPWHIRFSRGAFEASAALFFIILGIYLFFLALKKPIFYLFSGFFLILSLYTYHSPKIFVPLFLITIFLIFSQKIIPQIKVNKILFIIIFLILLSLSYFIIKDTFFSQGGTRSGTLIFFQNDQIVKFNASFLKQLLNNFWQHLSPRFYLYGTDSNYRNNLNDIGLMPAFQYIFFVFGFIILLKPKNNKLSIFLFLWFFIGLIPGILSQADAVPHTIRSLNALPATIFISALGFVYLFEKLKIKKFTVLENQQSLYKFGIIVFCILIFLSIKYLYIEYFEKFPLYSAHDWQYGYEEVALITQKLEPEVDKIIITSAYQHPYEAIAFYQKRNPLYVIWGEMSKYQYVDVINWDGDKFCSNCLLIGTQQETPKIFNEKETILLDNIYYPNNDIVFKIVKTY